MDCIGRKYKSSKLRVIKKKTQKGGAYYDPPKSAYRSASRRRSRTSYRRPTSPGHMNALTCI